MPAYTFPILRLPYELQWKIWSMAARVKKPRVYPLLSMQQDKWHLDPYLTNDTEDHFPGSSRVLRNDLDQEKPEKVELGLLQACSISRKAAQAVCARLPYTCHCHSPPSAPKYHNTLYDSYYIGGGPWYEFKIFIDLLVQQNSSRPLPREIYSELAGLLSIRLLLVDLTIFGAAPIKLWAAFRMLEVLTIVYSPEDQFDEIMGPYMNFKSGCEPQFLQPI